MATGYQPGNIASFKLSHIQTAENRQININEKKNNNLNHLIMLKFRLKYIACVLRFLVTKKYEK